MLIDYEQAAGSDWCSPSTTMFVTCEVCKCHSDSNELDIRLRMSVPQESAVHSDKYNSNKCCCSHCVNNRELKTVLYQILSINDFDDVGYRRMWKAMMSSFEVQERYSTVPDRRELTLSCVLMMFWPQLFERISQFAFIQLTCDQVGQRSTNRTAELDYKSAVKPWPCDTSYQNTSYQNTSYQNTSCQNTSCQNTSNQRDTDRTSCSRTDRTCCNQESAQTSVSTSSVAAVSNSGTEVPNFELGVVATGGDLLAEHQLLAEWYLEIIAGRICVPVGCADIRRNRNTLVVSDSLLSESAMVKAVLDVSPLTHYTSYVERVDCSCSCSPRPNYHVTMLSGNKYVVDYIMDSIYVWALDNTGFNVSSVMYQLSASVNDGDSLHIIPPKIMFVGHKPLYLSQS